MFLVGVLYSAQEFISFVRNTPGIDLKFPEIFKSFYVASPKAILEVSQNCDWVQLNEHGYLEITEKGKQIVESKEPELALRIQIGNLIETYLPTWLPLLSHGRAETQKYLSKDIAQCFREAGLFGEVNDDIVQWWDKYSKISRKQGKDTKLDVGRRGEKLSIKHESERTGRNPVWQGFESNFFGYDILSVVSKDDLRPLLIEVKTSNSTLETAYFFITKYEWEVASVSTYYIFHLWALQPKPKLIAVSVESISRHIPINQGEGHWESVSIPFSPFVN
jgi:hypothetical protein